MTPEDELAVVGPPGFWRPDADEVHISVTFTWDVGRAIKLKKAWEAYYPIVKIGGPAITGSTDEFIPGMYLKEGVTITSRGCPRNCPWCLVPISEGPLKLLEIKPGHIVQDNNLLATPRQHQEKVFEMLRSLDRNVTLSGGLDARLLTDWVADQLRKLKIHEIFLAADTAGSAKHLTEAGEKLKFLERRKKRCYVLIGYDGESMEEAERRLYAVWDAGFLPFSQLYQPQDRFIDYSTKWKTFNRLWSRPALMRNHMGGY